MSTSSIPMYEQIQNELMEQIQSGVFQPGDRIPSEKELAERYHVSRITAVKALTELALNDVEGFTGERFSDYVEDSEKYSAKLMPGMIPTAEEADQVSPFLTDSDSYVQEARMKFVTGQWNFDSDWDAYVNQLNAMGAEDYVTVKQAQYDRYLSK